METVNSNSSFNDFHAIRTLDVRKYLFHKKKFSKTCLTIWMPNYTVSKKNSYIYTNIRSRIYLYISATAQTYKGTHIQRVGLVQKPTLPPRHRRRTRGGYGVGEPTRVGRPPRRLIAEDLKYI